MQLRKKTASVVGPVPALGCEAITPPDKKICLQIIKFQTSITKLIQFLHSSTQEDELSAVAELPAEPIFVGKK